MPRTTSNDLQSKSAYQDYFKQKTFKERQEALVQEEAEQKRQFASNSGDKPFPCDVCGREFKRRSNMIAHMKTHDTDRKKIECTEANCGA